MNKIFKYGQLEERFFAIVILCTIPYYILNLATIFSYDDTNPTLVIIYAVLLIVSISIIFFTWKRSVNQLAINIFSLFILFAFTYYLPKSGGATGGSGYVIQNIIVLLILMTKGHLKIFVTIVLAVVTVVLFTDLLTFSGQIIYTRLITDYLVNLLFISIFMVFFKYNFDNERKELTLRNEELKALNEDLLQQANELEKTNDEIQAIRDNLQEKVIERTKKLEEENDKLLEYSFINAHLVRAPMANIIGITDLHPDDPKFLKIKEGISEMDEVVRKIADVLK